MVQYTLPSNQCNYSRQFDKNKKVKGLIGFQTQSKTFVLITVIDLTSVQSSPRSVIMLHREQEITLVGLILEEPLEGQFFQLSKVPVPTEQQVLRGLDPRSVGSSSKLLGSGNFQELLPFDLPAPRQEILSQLLFALPQHSLISSFSVLQYLLHKFLLLNDLC